MMCVFFHMFIPLKGWSFPKSASTTNLHFQTFEPKKQKPPTFIYFPLYWLFNRDLSNGLLKSPYNWAVFDPLYNPTNQGPFFRGSFEEHDDFFPRKNLKE